MLNIYTRHSLDCEHHGDMGWRRCRCPKWIRGVLPNGRKLRTSAKTRSWEQAEKFARKLEDATDPLREEQMVGAPQPFVTLWIYFSKIK